MDKKKIFIIAAVGLVVIPIPILGGLRITNEIQIETSAVTGPGSLSSVETSGGILTNTLGVSFNGENDSLDYYVNISGRATNNRNIDYRDFSFSRIQAYH